MKYLAFVASGSSASIGGWELIREGGISTPAWIFFTALLTLIADVLRRLGKLNTKIDHNGSHDPVMNKISELDKKIDRRFDNINSRVDRLEDIAMGHSPRTRKADRNG